jgi:L-threonylcarbamoyladenylate synthase
MILTFDQTAAKLKTGAVGVLPTDTIFGLVASAENPDAVQRMYTIKHRENKPGTLIAASVDQLVELGIPRRYLTPVAQYWPNPVSVVIPVHENLDYLHLGKYSLAVRIPKNDQLQRLLKETGPLATTSVNMPGEKPANTLDEATAYFGETVDFYVDGGDYSGHKPSTVIRIVDDAVEVLREGAVKINQ